MVSHEYGSLDWMPEGEAGSFVDRLCDLYDDCSAAARHPSGRVIPAGTPRDLYPRMTEADWLRIQLFHGFSRVLARYGVADPAGLGGVGLGELAALAAPYILDEPGFDRYLAQAAPDHGAEQAAIRRVWTQALTAPAIGPGETAAAAMARLHSGLRNQDAYALGLQDLEAGHTTAARYFFLVPYAVGRHRQAPPPRYGALTAPETFAVDTMMRALGAGFDVPETMARLPLGIQFRTHTLSERLYDFQVAVLQLLQDNDLPEVLPNGPPLAEADVVGLGPCEAALHLVAAAIDVAAEGCRQMGLNAAPLGRGDAGQL